jgi:hypothetical protein
MAHWIIDDHGFGGTFYRCSECGESQCDIFDKHCGGETCPGCGSPMNEDDAVYMKNGKREGECIEKDKNRAFRPSIIFYPTSTTETIRAYDEMNAKLKQLTGYDMKKLLELFAAGYTLEPPKPQRSLQETLRDLL